MDDIFYHTEKLNFKPKNWAQTVDWLKECILLEGKKCGQINYIFCKDDHLLAINQDYLKHDTYTDVITFNYVEGEVISADIFISIERITENATTFKVDFQKEFLRVLVHGLLHLLGYDDQTKAKAQEIRKKEDYCLTLHPQI